MVPIRIVSADHDYVDSEGHIWGANRCFQGGKL